MAVRKAMVLRCCRTSVPRVPKDPARGGRCRFQGGGLYAFPALSQASRGPPPNLPHPAFCLGMRPVHAARFRPFWLFQANLEVTGAPRVPRTGWPDMGRTEPRGLSHLQKAHCGGDMVAALAVRAGPASWALRQPTQSRARTALRSALQSVPILDPGSGNLPDMGSIASMRIELRQRNNRGT